MPFSQIIPPSPSPSESKSPLYTSVSFFLSCIQGRHCDLPKFHIYVLVYCIGVFLSGLLHSGFFLSKHLEAYHSCFLKIIKWAITSKALRKYLAFDKCYKMLTILMCLTIHFLHVNHYIKMPEQNGRFYTRRPI